MTCGSMDKPESKPPVAEVSKYVQALEILQMLAGFARVFR